MLLVLQVAYQLAPTDRLNKGFALPSGRMEKIMSWFNTGSPSSFEGPKDGLDYSPNRFWIPAGQSRELVFVDFVSGHFKEHQAKINGNWRNWITCLGPLMDANEVAPCCSSLGSESAYNVSLLTMVDCSKWTDKKGTSHQYELKLYPAKYKTVQKLVGKNKRQIDDGRGPMTGKLYRVVRETDKSPAVGDEFEYIRDIDPAKLFDLVQYQGKRLVEHYTQAEQDPAYFARLSKVFSLTKQDDGTIARVIPSFNYMTLFAPKDKAEIRKLLTGYVPEERSGYSTGGFNSGGSGRGAGGRADEEVPF